MLISFPYWRTTLQWISACFTKKLQRNNGTLLNNGAIPQWNVSAYLTLVSTGDYGQSSGQCMFELPISYCEHDVLWPLCNFSTAFTSCFSQYNGYKSILDDNIQGRNPGQPGLKSKDWDGENLCSTELVCRPRWQLFSEWSHIVADSL